MLRALHAESNACLEQCMLRAMPTDGSILTTLRILGNYLWCELRSCDFGGISHEVSCSNEEHTLLAQLDT